MPFTQDTITGSAWCSRRDAVFVLENLARILGDDAGRLDQAIEAATGEAQSILRSRWPDDWPFGSPPPEVREAVATMAVYRATRGRTFSGGLEDMVAQLRGDADRSRRWLDDVANSKAHLELVSVSGGHVAAKAGAPTGEFGFYD